MSTQSIGFRPPTQQPSTLTNIKDAFVAAGDGQHLRFSKEKGLHTHSRFGPSSIDFKAFFGNTDALKARDKLRQDATNQIKTAINVEYGPGMAERVFARVGGNYKDGFTKADVERFDRAAKELAGEDVQKAKDLLGDGPSMISIFTGFVGHDRTDNQERYQALEGQLAGAVVRAEAHCKEKGIDCTPEMLKRAVIGEIIKQDLVDVLSKTKPEAGEKAAVSKGETLTPHLLDSFRLTDMDIQSLRQVIDRFCGPTGDFNDADLTIARRLLLEAAKTGNVSSAALVPKQYDAEAIKTLPTGAKLERMENYIEALLEPSDGDGLVHGEVQAFMRSQPTERTDPGYAEFMMMRMEAEPSYTKAMDNIETRAKGKTIDFLGESFVVFTQEENASVMDPNLPKRPEILDVGTNQMRPKTDEEMTKEEASTFKQQSLDYDLAKAKNVERRKELTLAHIMTEPKAKDVPLETIAFFDQAFKELLGGDFSDTTLQQKVDSLPESYCRMLATAHDTIDRSATFDFTDKQLEGSTEEELIKAGKQDLKDKVDINLIMLRVLAPIASDRAIKNPAVRKQMQNVSIMLQCVANGTSPLRKGKNGHHPEVEKSMNQHMVVWQQAMETFTQKVLERGIRLNGG